MEVSRHVEILRAEGKLLAGAAREADLDAAVPDCPQWQVRDLVQHIGGVHR
ncbi:MAG: maleylpyruvate isomerase N-terminal domain-containing protein, partial [Acidimicrobiales bacterium]